MTLTRAQCYFLLRYGTAVLLGIGLVAGPFAQGRMSIEGFGLGQNLAACPAGVEKQPTPAGGWMCIFPDSTKSVFGQSARALRVSADKDGEIDLILAVGIPKPEKAASAAARKYGAANRTRSFPTGETIWEWMRDDDTLSIVGSKREPFISLSTISPSAARNAAARFSEMADKCLVDVRDKGISYEASSSCPAASSLHIDYLNVDQHQHWVDTTRVPKHAYDVALARGVLWSAVVISNERHGSRRTGLW